MKYLLLIYVTEPDLHTPPPDVLARHLAMTEAAIARRSYIASYALESTARSVRVRPGAGETLVTDGPFAESKEVLGGVYIVDCAAIEDAIPLAAKIPITASGCVEVRPVAEVAGWDEAVAEMRNRLSAANS